MIAAFLAMAFAQQADPGADAAVELRLENAVSATRGRRGGFVVMYPRIIPATLDSEVAAAASKLQGRLEAIVRRTAPRARRDVRPAPERVCPRDKGCRATSVGVLLGHQDGGCVAVAILGPPGESPRELIPLAGRVDLASASIPFRAPPETSVTVREFVPCSQLDDFADDAAVVLRMRELLRDQ